MGQKLSYVRLKLTYMRPKLKGIWCHSKEALVEDELTWKTTNNSVKSTNNSEKKSGQGYNRKGGRTRPTAKT